MMRVSQEVLQMKIDWFDPHMKGELIPSPEDAQNKGKHQLYTKEEEKYISEEARSYFLACDSDLEILKNKAAKYGRDLKQVPIDGDCLLHAVRDQTEINPKWSIMENRQTLGFYLAKLPEQFFMYAEAYCTEQSYESYVRNFFNGTSYGDELIAGVWGHIWNMKVTIISPHVEDLKVFHDDDENPDVVIVHNGRPDTDGHYFSTCMHNKKSKKLPLIGSNHTYKISVLGDVAHHAKNAEQHYKEVKCRQCINDYNCAVSDLSNLYSDVMEAKELEQDLSQALTEVRTKIENLNKTITKCDHQLLLSKAKLQVLGISTKELHKLKPVSQGTQAQMPDIQQQPQQPQQPQRQQEILVIDDDEEDIAVKGLLASEKITIPVTTQAVDVVNMPQFTFTAPQNIAYTIPAGHEVMITPQNAAIGSATQQNVAYGSVTGQNVITGENIVTGQNVITGQNIVTGQNVVIGDENAAVEYAPIYPPRCS